MIKNKNAATVNQTDEIVLYQYFYENILPLNHHDFSI